MKAIIGKQIIAMMTLQTTHELYSMFLNDPTITYINHHIRSVISHINSLYMTIHILLALVSEIISFVYHELPKRIAKNETSQCTTVSRRSKRRKQWYSNVGEKKWDTNVSPVDLIHINKM